MEHPVDEGRGHALDNGGILRTVAGADDDAALRQMVFSDAAFMNQRVERFLHFLRACIELIQEQAVGLFPGDHLRRQESADILLNLRDADDVFGSQLAAQKGDAGKSHGIGESLHERGFSDTRRAPDEDRTDRRHMKEQF